MGFQGEEGTTEAIMVVSCGEVEVSNPTTIS